MLVVLYIVPVAAPGKAMFLEQAAAESGLSVEAMTEYTSLSFSAWKKGTKFETASADDDTRIRDA